MNMDVIEEPISRASSLVVKVVNAWLAMLVTAEDRHTEERVRSTEIKYSYKVVAS